MKEIPLKIWNLKIKNYWFLDFNSLEKNEDKDVLINAFESEFEKRLATV